MINKKKYISPDIARALGLNINATNRYRLNAEKTAMLKELRKNLGLLKANALANVEVSNVPYYWDKSKDLSVFIKNPLFDPNKDFIALKTELIDEVKKYAPKYKTFEREVLNEGHLFLIDPADVHIGKLCSAFEVGETYNNQIAVQRVLSGVNGLIDKIRGFDIDKVNLIIGNDILHIDNPKRTTTSGTPQDTDGFWHSNFIIAKKLYVDVIERLLNISDVHVTYNPSNHDYTNGFFLAQVIEAHFLNCPQVTFDTSIAHRKYFVYFDNVIGTTHGDGAKLQDLPLLMAHEAPNWSECKKRYWYTHHLHHKVAKDFMGVTVETLRSPSGTDSWHHRNGYEHAPKAIEGFIHHKQHGQIARFTHYF
jgi:hypothetical protein